MYVQQPLLSQDLKVGPFQWSQQRNKLTSKQRGKERGKSRERLGRGKRAYIVVLRQAKFYLPRQAAAAAANVLRCRSTQDTLLSIVYCGSCTAAAI